VADDVRRELRADHEIDPSAVDLVEIEQAPEQRLREHARARVPLEGDGHEVRFVAQPAQLLGQPLGEVFGATARERHLRSADGDPHEMARMRSSSPRSRSFSA
jgi:hypothetical protein